MITELLHNRAVGDLLRGASIILAVEPPVRLDAAMHRSRIAEGSSESDFDEAVRLVAQIRRELGINGDDEPNHDEARKILDHMLKDPPWGRISEKQELP